MVAGQASQPREPLLHGIRTLILSGTTATHAQEAGALTPGTHCPLEERIICQVGWEMVGRRLAGVSLFEPEPCMHTHQLCVLWSFWMFSLDTPVTRGIQTKHPVAWSIQTMLKRNDGGCDGSTR